jgi:hypothetical protein
MRPIDIPMLFTTHLACPPGRYVRRSFESAPVSKKSTADASRDATSWAAISDERLKKNIKPLSVLDHLKGGVAFSFDWKDDGRHEAVDVVAAAPAEDVSRPSHTHEGQGRHVSASSKIRWASSRCRVCANSWSESKSWKV